MCCIAKEPGNREIRWPLIMHWVPGKQALMPTCRKFTGKCSQEQPSRVQSEGLGPHLGAAPTLWEPAPHAAPSHSFLCFSYMPRKWPPGIKCPLSW